MYSTGVVHASAFAFDADQQLWVATAAYTDAGHDGVYLVARSGATPVEVISGLHTVLGLLWYHDSLYVASKDRVDAYGDLHGNRFGTHRTIVKLPTGVGEVNNIVLAPNGNMLLGITAPCDHCAPTSEYSGAILSFAPDGTALHLYASGIRAPVGLTYLPGTSDLLVTMDIATISVRRPPATRSRSSRPEPRGATPSVTAKAARPAPAFLRASPSSISTRR